jgi:hypothetical protein
MKEFIVSMRADYLGVQIFRKIAASSEEEAIEKAEDIDLISDVDEYDVIEPLLIVSSDEPHIISEKEYSDYFRGSRKADEMPLHE